MRLRRQRQRRESNVCITGPGAHPNETRYVNFAIQLTRIGTMQGERLVRMRHPGIRGIRDEIAGFSHIVPPVDIETRCVTPRRMKYRSRCQRIAVAVVQGSQARRAVSRVLQRTRVFRHRIGSNEQPCNNRTARPCYRNNDTGQAPGFASTSARVIRPVARGCTYGENTSSP